MILIEFICIQWLLLTVQFRGASDFTFLASSDVGGAVLIKNLYCLAEVSSTNIIGIMHTSIANPITVIFGNPLFIENAISMGATKDPSCENPSIEPAPIDWISNGND